MHGFRERARTALLSLLYRVPGLRDYARKRLPVHGKGYRHYWVDEGGKGYRDETYVRQRAGGTKPLIENPSVAEIRTALDSYGAKTVLEAGCGWGRLMEELAPYYDIEGCDVSEDLLAKARKDLTVFVLDIVDPDPTWMAAHENAYDVVFCRAVMMYFYKEPEEMRSAMKTLARLARTKVIVWEWPHVEDAMRRAHPSPLFDYRPMLFREE